MPYTVTVESLLDCRIQLIVEPEQSDSDVFYESASFALGLLAFPDDAGYQRPSPAMANQVDFNGLTEGSVDTTPYIRTWSVAIARRGSQARDERPLARYTIEVTQANWLAHLRSGDRYTTHMYCDDDRFLADAVCWETETPRAQPVWNVGDRVRARHSRAVDRAAVVAHGRVSNPPAHWGPCLDVVKVFFDDGHGGWLVPFGLEAAPDDAYEKAVASPESTFDWLLQRSTVERCDWIHRIALRGGGTWVRPVTDPASIAEGLIDVGFEHRARRLYALLARLAWPRRFEVAARLFVDAVGDRLNHQRVLAQRIPGHGSEAGDSLEPGFPLYFTPLPLLAGALILVTAARVREGATAPLAQVPTTLLDEVAFSAAELSNLNVRGRVRPSRPHEQPYLVALGRRTALPLPVEMWTSQEPDNASTFGLDSGAVFWPSEEDRYR